MLNDLIEYVSRFMDKGELFMAGIGFIWLVALWVMGGIYEKEKEEAEKSKE